MQPAGMRLRPRLWVAVTSVLAVVVLSGCSDSGESQNGGGTRPPADEASGATAPADDAPTVTVDAAGSDSGHVEPPPGGWSGIFGEDMAWCMGELGWEATVEDEGRSFQVFHDESQADEFEAASEACTEATGQADHDFFTDDALSVGYDDRVQQAECMRELGYEISEPPSREVFIEQSQQERIAVYEPSLDIPQSENEAAQEACPRMPPWELIEEAGQ